MNEILMRIILAIITLLGTITTGVLVPYLNKKYDNAKNKDIEFWGGLAVQAAEKRFNIPKSGEEKKQFVISYLINKGVKISEDDMSILIDALVEEIINKPYQEWKK